MAQKAPERRLRPIFAVPALLLLASQLGAAAPPATQPATSDINRIVLRVNDEILTLQDYEQQKARRLAAVLNDAALSPAKRQERVAAVGKEVLQESLREMLMQSQARRLAISISDREVEETIGQIRKEQGIETDEQFLEALAASGMTLEQLQKSMRRELTMSRLIQKDVTSKIEVSDDDLRAYYRNHPDEFKVPEERKLTEVIVLESSGLPAAELEKTAKTLYDQLQAGKDPKETVGSLQDQGISTGWVDLGWLKRGELEKSLADAVWSLEVGRYTPPVKARGGFHIARCDEKKGGELRPFGEVEKEILSRERQKRFGKEMRSYLARLEQGSYIQENLPADGIGYRALAGEIDEEDELKGFRSPTIAEPTPENAETPSPDAAKPETPTAPSSGQAGGGL